MHEIAPGLWHWTVTHPHIHSRVSSYYLLPERVVIDGLIPREGLEWFEQQGPPEHIVMTNRHHDRDAWRIRDAFGASVHCVRNGVHEVAGRGPVEPFDFGTELPGGIMVYEVDAICPDETALHIPSRAALACADGVIRSGGDGPLGFVPDYLMDEPEQTKEGLRAAYRRLLAELEFELLLLAHGEPVLSGAKDALRAFVDRA
jgi:hypothetical protein